MPHRERDTIEKADPPVFSRLRYDADCPGDRIADAEVG